MLRSLLTCCLMTGLYVPADAAMLGTGNVLVSDLFAGTLSEYTTAGVFIQSFTIPDSSEGSTSDLRDIIVDANGQIQAYNGTFEAELVSLDPQTSTIVTQPFAELSSGSNASFGGIAVLNDSVFLSDMNTGGGEAQGIVRFSTTGDPAVRFATSQEYQDLTLGLDGNLYALRLNNLFIDVYDPLTNALIRTIELDLASAVGDIRGVSVDSSGLLYLAGWNGSIYQADSDGNFMSSLVTGFNKLTDIDINNSGNLLAGTFSGDVIFSDTSLSPVTSFTIPSSTTLSVHVSFTDPLLVQEASVPEPTSLALLGLSACGFGVAARRRRKVARRSDPLRDGRE